MQPSDPGTPPIGVPYPYYSKARANYFSQYFQYLENFYPVKRTAICTIDPCASCKMQGDIRLGNERRFGWSEIHRHRHGELSP